MTNENELIKKLMVSKAIMDKHRSMSRSGDVLPNYNTNITTPLVESYEPPQSKFNIPEEFVSQPQIQQPQTMSQDKILNSKLPDEIKRLMIEHPITPQNPMVGPTLSNDLIDKASRLMSVDASGKQISEQPKRKTQGQVVSESVLDGGNLRNMLKEVVREVLMENGIISESTKNTDEQISFKVGKHIFEGRVTKIKKIK